MTFDNQRRQLFLSLSAVALGLSLPAHAKVQAKRVVRIGHQKSAFTLLKNRQTLEKTLAPFNVSVTWTEFTAGPVLLEALNVGAIDFGEAGEAPPIFAQAAGAPLAYVAHSPPRPKQEALIVPAASPIHSVTDLKGKRVAYNKGSNVHFFLVKLLEAHGLQYSDVQSVFLPPADARAAFARGSVDAWLIWDPFLAAAEAALDTRLIADATHVVNNREYYLSSLDYARNHPDVIATVIAELDAVEQWLARDREAAAQTMSPILGLPLDVVQRSVARATYGVLPITPEVLQEQQAIADTFLRLKLIPRAIDVRAAAV